MNARLPRPGQDAEAAAHPVRMEDVARAAGVSLVTVSRAINDPDKLAPATLSTVRAAIEALRYVPNLTAGSLAAKRTRIVAAVVPTIGNSIFSETVDGLSQVLGAAGYQLLLGQTQYDAAQEHALVQAFLGRRVDGLVLTGVAHARGLRATLQRHRVPVVETWDLTHRPIDMLVGFDNHRAGEQAAQFLHQRARRRLAYIGGGDDRSRARLAGLTAAAAALGLPAPRTVALSGQNTIAAAADAMDTLCAVRPLPDAVFCSNDMLAAGALFACQRRGLKVPGDVALMGFADLPIAAVTEPALSTVRVRSADIGRNAGRLLLARLAGTPERTRTIDLGFEIVQRGST